MKKGIFIVIAFIVFVALTAQGQELRRVYFDADQAADVSDSSRLAREGESVADRLHGSVSLGTGVFSGWGSTLGYTFLNPELSYKLSDRVVLSGGFGHSKGFSYGDVHLRGLDRSFAPRRQRSMNYMHFDGIVRVNERLTVAASVFMMQGNMSPWLADGRDGYAVGASAAMQYRFGKDNYLSLYMEYIRSENMPLPLYCYDYGMMGWGGLSEYRMFGHSQFRLLGD